MSAKNYLAKIGAMETPFYFYDMGLLEKTLGEVARESSRYGYKVHYAMKANFDVRILELVHKMGLGADCVSGNEVRMAIENGFKPSEVVFAGVGKSDKEIIYSLENDIFAFNVESLHELEIIDSLAAGLGRRARIAFRINPDVDPQTHKHISTGKADSKFGISYKEVDRAIASLSELKNVDIVGLHFHIGSQIRNMEVFTNLCDRVNTIKEWFKEKGVEIKHLNLGGGLGINYDAPDAELIPDFATYFATFNKHLRVDKGQTVHFELGRSIVGQCGELITKVLYNKGTASGSELVIVDASMTELIRPALYSAKHVIQNLTSTAAPKTYTVAGPVCESTDVFAKDIELPKTSRGDLLTLRSAGAYGEAMASRYNMRDLPEAVYSDRL